MKNCEKMQSYLATASKTWGSCSHFFRASTLLVFLWGLASKNTASAHRIPCRKEKWDKTEFEITDTYIVIVK